MLKLCCVTVFNCDWSVACLSIVMSTNLHWFLSNQLFLYVYTLTITHTHTHKYYECIHIKEIKEMLMEKAQQFACQISFVFI